MTNDLTGRERRAAVDAERAEAFWGMAVVPDDRNASPTELARVAYDRGDRLFQVDVPISYTQGNVAAALTGATRTVHLGHTDFLGEIESHGWRLEHVSTAYVQQGTVAAANYQQAHHGALVALYVFRRAGVVA